MAAAIDHFGPFTLDRARRRLTADGRPLTLPERHFDVLLALTSQPGVILSKEHLIETAWRGTAVGDDSLYRAIRDLRETLGSMPNGQPHIETHARRGFRFAAPLVPAPTDRTSSATPPPTRTADSRDSSHVAQAVTDTAADRQTRIDLTAAATIDRLLEPHLAFIDGRTALETLHASEIARARDAFSRALDLQPDLTAAHVGLASAYLFQYESTRADATPDRDALARAEQHALHACSVQPGYADAWGTYAHVAHRLKKYDAGNDDRLEMRDVAAARKAVSLEPIEWRHHLRLAFVSGGGERLRAAQRVLELRPGFALAHWMAATVLVGRQALTAARTHLRAGCDAQDSQSRANAGFAAVGLHLLHGLVLAAVDELEAAHAELAREVDTAPAGHIYAREACANALYARGALYLRTGDAARARVALESALERLPSHPLARIALGASTRKSGAGKAAANPEPPLAAGPTELALVQAAILAMQGRHADAARVCELTLDRQRTGPGALWLLPVEPLIHTAANPPIWTRVNALLQQRSA